MKLTILVAVLAAAFFGLLAMTIFAVISCEGGNTMPNTVIQVIPSKIVVAAGEKFTVNVNIQPTVPISGAQFNIAYDPTAISVDSVTEGGLFKQNNQQSFFQPGTISSGQVVNVAGATLGAGSQVSTSGTFAVLNCTAITGGKQSMFVLSKYIVADKTAVPVPLDAPVITQVAVASPWDLNSDGKIDGSDLVVLSLLFGTTDAKADFNHNGIVDVLDMIMLCQQITGS